MKGAFVRVQRYTDLQRRLESAGALLWTAYDASLATAHDEVACLVEDDAPQGILTRARALIGPVCPLLRVSWALDSIASGCSRDKQGYSVAAAAKAEALAPSPAGPPGSLPALSSKRPRTSSEHEIPTKLARSASPQQDVKASKFTQGGGAASGAGGSQTSMPSANASEDSVWMQQLPQSLHFLARLVTKAGANKTQMHPPPGDVLGAQEVPLLPADAPRPQIERHTWYSLNGFDVHAGFAALAGQGVPAASACGKQGGIAAMFKKAATGKATALPSQHKAQGSLNSQPIALLHDYSRWGQSSVYITNGWGSRYGVQGGPLPLLAVDVDDTLTRTAKTCKVFAGSADDWTWWHPDVPQVLRAIHEGGLPIALLTNQSGASGADAAKRGALIRDKLAGIAEALYKAGVPTCTIAATGSSDFFRKPRPGMWLLAQNLLCAAPRVDEGIARASIGHMLRLCSYVGDAAGRSLDEKVAAGAHTPQKTSLQKSAPKRRQDHGLSDLFMACNAGIAFLTPDALFAGITSGTCGNAFSTAAVLACAKDRHTPRQLFANSQLQQRTDTWQQHLTQLQGLMGASPCVFVSVGGPGSGKSTWAAAVCQDLPEAKLVIVNQDTLRTKSKCLSVAREALEAGCSVIVDATNVSCQVRSDWIQLAQSLSARSVALLFPSDVQRAMHLNAFRGSCPFSMPCGATEQRYVPSRALRSLQPTGPPPQGEFDLTLAVAEPALVQTDSRTGKVMRMFLS